MKFTLPTVTVMTVTLLSVFSIGASASTEFVSRCVSDINSENIIELEVKNKEIISARTFFDYSLSVGTMKKMFSMKNDRTRYSFDGSQKNEIFDVDNSVLVNGNGTLHYKDVSNYGFVCAPF